MKIKYPKVGEKFYWKDQEGNISEDTCLKIEGDDIQTLETMFFIHISKNGGGCFVTESDLIRMKLKNSKKNRLKRKLKKLLII